ncbi:hypothetical protein I5535_19015 [Rhodobacteraceae bacterium F11138]|nr:hypothetical protein [Rhodobacteraceae bacterium F11138]
MRKTAAMLGLVLLFLALLDTGVAVVLHWAEAQGRMGSLVRYFDYGRSVPGKLAQWEADPDAPGSLYNVAWRQGAIAVSSAEFAAETDDTGPVIRSYGMSFVNHIMIAAQEQDPDLRVDRHSGPGAPPNFTYALFQEDRGNRRAGDVVVLGILSSSVPAMAALSNRSWTFEQPAPFTYPVFLLNGEEVKRVEPLINSAEQERALAHAPARARAWADQLAAWDAFYSPITFGAVWLDASPLARLVRRSLGTAHVAQVKAEILAGSEYPYVEVLNRMIMDFARTAQADGQIPIVVLVQTRNPVNVDVLEIARPALERADVAYLATVEHFDPADVSGFVSDGHYRPGINARFGKVFLDLVDTAGFQR